jgi:DNA-directed RNA polymerase
MFDKGLTFAAVHDSFWTHGCDVDKMNVYIREEFIKLYENDPLIELKKCLEQRFPSETIPDLPKKGNLNLKDILKSKYFFS